MYTLFQLLIGPIALHSIIHRNSETVIVPIYNMNLYVRECLNMVKPTTCLYNAPLITNIFICIYLENVKRNIFSCIYYETIKMNIISYLRDTLLC